MVSRGEDSDAPGASFAHSYSWPCQILPQTLVVFRQSPELELGHGLFVWTGIHLVVNLAMGGGGGLAECVGGGRTRERESGDRLRLGGAKRKAGGQRPQRRVVVYWRCYEAD